MLARLRTNKTPLDNRSLSGLLVQLFFFIILPLAILLLAISFISQSLHEQAMRSLVGERDARAVSTAATAIEEDIREHMDSVRMLGILAENVAQDGLSDAYAQADFNQVQFDGGMGLLKPDGELLILTAGDGSLAALKPALQVPGQNLLQGPLSQFMSDAFDSPVSGERMLVILEAAPGRSVVAAGAVSILNLTQSPLKNLLAGDHATNYFLVDREARAILAQSHASSESDLSANPGVAAALQGQSGTTYIDQDGNKAVVAYSAIPILGWGLVSEEAWEMVSTPNLRSTQLAPLILAPFLLLMLLALWYGARQIVDPLRKLEERASRLAWGDYQSIQEPVDGLAEIRSLHKELVHMAEKVQAAQKGMQDYAGAVTAAQEDERRRLAQELHDDTIQSLIALKQRGQLLRLQMKGRLTEQELGELSELLRLTEKTIENLRRQIRALRPVYLEELGLSTALDMLAQESSQSCGVPIHFQRTGEEQRLDDAVELAFYRIAQEALSNIAWHAGANSALVELAFSPQIISLVIQDDGVGFQAPRTPAELAIEGHFGLLGITERADLIGAALDIQSTPGKGTKIKIDYSGPKYVEEAIKLGKNA